MDSPQKPVEANNREAVERLTLPKVKTRFEDVEAVFVGTPKTSGDNSFKCEINTGTENRLEYGKLIIQEAPGRTWKDYLEEEETLTRWLTSQSIGQSKHRVLVIDTVNPLSVLVAKNEKLCRDAYITAITANESSTPAEKNTSYAALKTLHSWKTPTSLATEEYIQNLTAFDEKHGLLRGKQALNKTIQTIIDEITIFAAFMNKDRSLGVETHAFSALTSASDRVYRNTYTAIQTQTKNTSTTFTADDVLTLRLLASSHWKRTTDIEHAYRSIRNGYPNLIDSEIRLRERKTRNDLYDVNIVFGLKRDPTLQFLKEGYDAVAKRVSKLKLEAHT